MSRSFPIPNLLSNLVVMATYSQAGGRGTALAASVRGDSGWGGRTLQGQIIMGRSGLLSFFQDKNQEQQKTLQDCGFRMN